MIDALKAFFVNHNVSILELTDCTHKKMQTIVSLCLYVGVVPIKALISCVLWDLVCTLHFPRVLSVDLLCIVHRNIAASHTTLALNLGELEPGQVMSQKK